jgi:heme/copper-type cytochrome/quinol oxidase subunit 2
MRLFSKGTQLKFLFLYLLIQAIQFVNTGFTQTPTHIPRDSRPVDFFDSTENIIVFIVLPVVIVVLYFLWRKQRAKQKDQDKNNTKSESGE